MKKKGLIVLVIVLILIVLLGVGFKLKENTLIYSNEKEENTLKQEEYTVHLTEEEGHYVLTVQTNLINHPFSFAYDSKNFMLDTSSHIFDNITATEEEGNKKYTLELESNKLYKFYFIKKNDTKMELERNILFK